MIAMLALATVLFGGYLYFASPSRVAKLAGDLLAGMTGAEVRIQWARFGFDGTIMLQGLEIRVAEAHGDAGRLFDAPQVLIKHDLLSLFRGRFRPQLLTFITPTLHLTELTDTNVFNFQRLHEQRQAGPPSAAPTMPQELPEIRLRNGRIQFGEVAAGRFETLGTVQLSGNLLPAVDRRGVYFFSLRQQPTQASSSHPGPVLAGKLDLQRLTVEAGVEQLTFGSPQRSMLPRRLRRWWDLLEPVGSLPSVQFGYNPDPQVGFYADLQLNDIAITLPYGELDSRMTGVSGRFSIANETIEVTDLTGEIEGLRYTISGRVQGFSHDAPFTLSAQTQRFAIPDQPRYLLALPTAVQKQFRRFSPQGTFIAQVQIERRKPGGQLTYDGSVQVHDARMLFEHFKYPLHHVRGLLRFNDEQIELINFQGQGQTGAQVTVSGRIAPPSQDAAVHIVVTAQNAPIDSVLRQAIPQQHRDMIDTFFYQTGYDRLIDRGLIQTTHQQTQRLNQLELLRAHRHDLAQQPTPNRDVLASLDAQLDQIRKLIETPVFDLGGRTTVVAETQRTMGHDNPFRTTIGLSLAEANGLYRYWPYPIRGRAGRLLIKPDRVIVDQIQVQGITGAVGTINGSIDLPSDQRPYPIPKLRLAIDAMPSDPVLFASLPQPHGQWLSDLGLTGELHAAGRIGCDTHNQIDFDIQIDLQRGGVQPYGGRLKVEALVGNATLKRSGLEVHTLAGRYGSGRLSLQGHADWSQDPPQLGLTLSGQAIPIDAALLDLLPPDHPKAPPLHQRFAQHQPTGLFDTDVTYRTVPDQPPDMKIDLRLHELGVELSGQRITLTDIQGSLIATATGIALKGWGGSLDTGQFRAWGQAAFDPQLSYDLTFDARSQQIGPVTRAMLPQAVREVIEGLSLNGGYKIQQARLVHHPEAEPPEFEFRGQAQLTGATAALGVPITDMDGRLSIHAKSQDGSQWPSVDLRFDAQRLRAANRLTSPLSLRIATAADRSDLLNIRDLRGACYGGTLLGSGRVQLGQGGYYQMKLVVQDVAMDPFVRPEKYPDPPTADTGSSPHAGPLHNTDPAPASEPSEPEDPYTGILAANLDIEGSLDQPNRRRGRGQMEIRNSNLYEVPLSLALMHLLNLSFPSASSFDRASASYLIEDDQIWFDAIRFEAPTIEIVGWGAMQYDTLALDLLLHTRNPSSPKLGALSELLGVFKDELLSIQVKGTLADPKPEATSFQGFKQSWAEIFGSPEKQDYAPVSGVRGNANTWGQ